MSQDENEPQKIADYYETAEHIAWEFLTEGHVHLGYWDEENQGASFAEGAKMLTELMIGKSEIEEGQHFCDIGCGVGGPAIMLAKKKGCFVDGVTLSEFQRQEAEKRAGLQGVGDKARFINADAVDLPFPDKSFDGGWFFESIFHMGHHDALSEAHRVLKPGSLLLLTDVADVGLLTEEERNHAKELCNVEYVASQDYRDLLHNAGFDLVELVDITKEVVVPLKGKFTEALKEKKNEVFDIFKQDEERMAEFARVAEKFEKIGYIIVKARRRG